MRAAALALSLASLSAHAFDFDDDERGLPTHYVSVQTGINLGLLEFDVASGHLIASLSTAIGLPFASQGNMMMVEARAGYAFALTPPGETMWFFDLVGEVLPGWTNASGATPQLLTATGFAVGFRYVHRSGLVLGFQAPIFGLAFGPWVDNQTNPTPHWDFGQSYAGFFFAHLLSSSLFTLGLHF